MPGFFRRFETQLSEPVQRLGVTLGRMSCAFDMPKAIEEDVKRPFGGEARVQLFE